MLKKITSIAAVAMATLSGSMTLADTVGPAKMFKVDYEVAFSRNNYWCEAARYTIGELGLPSDIKISWESDTRLKVGKHVAFDATTALPANSRMVQSAATAITYCNDDLSLAGHSNGDSNGNGRPSPPLADSINTGLSDPAGGTCVRCDQNP